MSDNYDKFREQLPAEETKITEKVAGELLDYFDYDRVYSKTELERFETDVKRYEQRDKKLRRKWSLKHWRDSPREQIKRQTARSFAGYMILRYGAFAKILDS
jgi:hypothetical protein